MGFWAKETYRCPCEELNREEKHKGESHLKPQKGTGANPGFFSISLHVTIIFKIT